MTCFKGWSVFVGTSVTVEECNVTMGTIPDRKYPYTDHEGVAAIFNVGKTESCKFVVILHMSLYLVI